MAYIKDVKIQSLMHLYCLSCSGELNLLSTVLFTLSGEKIHVNWISCKRFTTEVECIITFDEFG